MWCLSKYSFCKTCVNGTLGSARIVSSTIAWMRSCSCRSSACRRSTLLRRPASNPEAATPRRSQRFSGDVWLRPRPTSTRAMEVRVCRCPNSLVARCRAVSPARLPVAIGAAPLRGKFAAAATASARALASCWAMCGCKSKWRTTESMGSMASPARPALLEPTSIASRIALLNRIACVLLHKPPFPEPGWSSQITVNTSAH
mmetsp:Transcript_11851/g.34128  ORF Transcript_11851/g.34128 Transcript_11851/m.34128 type:complete len:201 (-) Transcript_11851:508-1110(-)